MFKLSFLRGVGPAVGALVLVTAVPTAAAAAPQKNPSIDVALAAPGEVAQGQRFNYVATISSGNSTLDDVRLSDALPDSVTYVQVVTDRGACSASSNVVRCALGTLPRRTTSKVTITVDARTEGSTSNTVRVEGTSGGTSAAGSASATTTITAVTAKSSPSTLSAHDGTPEGTYCDQYKHCAHQDRHLPRAFLSGHFIADGVRQFGGLAGKPVTFTMRSDGRPVCTATTGSDGGASCTEEEWDRVQPPSWCGSAQDVWYVATFAGDAEYEPSSGSARTTSTDQLEWLATPVLTTLPGACTTLNALPRP